MTLELNKWIESEKDDILQLLKEKRCNVINLMVKTNGLKNIPSNDLIAIQIYLGWLNAIEYLLTKEDFNGGFVRDASE